MSRFAVLQLITEETSHQCICFELEKIGRVLFNILFFLLDKYMYIYINICIHMFTYSYTYLLGCGPTLLNYQQFLHFARPERVGNIMEDTSVPWSTVPKAIWNDIAKQRNNSEGWKGSETVPSCLDCQPGANKYTTSCNERSEG